MAKKTLGSRWGNLIVAVLVAIVAGCGLEQVVKASMMYNTTYQFSFAYEGQELDTYDQRRMKEISNDSAYIQCTNAENVYGYFYAYFGYEDEFYNEINYSAPVCLSYGDQRWVATDAYYGTYCFFKGKLMDRGYAEDDEGCYFEGRWRPDSSIIN